MDNYDIGGIAQLITSDKSRLIYVEPNDSYDRQLTNKEEEKLDGNSITPKYEDFCVSFNLIVDKYSRFNSSGQISSPGANRMASIQWFFTPEQIREHRNSFLQGSDPDRANYLTTYYTEIGGDSYYKNTEIQGLGVERVDISYESWYTPTVVIKFVDIRGSALFGREEAIHVDEQITAHNIFGAFFSQPYPLFRLQVKGFLGKPITYQLTCSGFNGEYNAQTGNFEATAKFIGYSWSLLTDIPFAYLMAAPNCTYYGRDYWQEKCTTPEWGLTGSGNVLIAPPKLSDLFRQIRKSKASIKSFESAATAHENETLSSMDDEKNLLNRILNNLAGFRRSLEGDVGINNILHITDPDPKEENKEQMLLFGDKKEINLSNDTRTWFDDLKKSVEEYSSQYAGHGINKSKLPDEWETAPTSLGCEQKFTVITYDNGPHYYELTDKSLATVQNLSNLRFGSEGKKKLNKKFVDYLAQQNASLKNVKSDAKTTPKTPYVFLLNLKDLESKVYARENEFNKQKRDIVRAVNRRLNDKVTQIIGFKPYIGNIFKILFCHLETFCHILYHAAHEIDSQTQRGLRTPEYLGIDINASDIPEVKDQTRNVVPWPAIFETEKNVENFDDFRNVYAWVGDFSHNFIEEKVVYGFQEGIQEIMDDPTAPRNDNLTSMAFPIVPSDFVQDNTVFGSNDKISISELAGYLAMRSGIIAGVIGGNNLNRDLCKKLGKLDAYNFYITIADKNKLNNNYKQQLRGDKGEATILKGISHCDDNFYNFSNINPNGERNHDFELERKLNKTLFRSDHHAMFKNEGNIENYVHWYGKSGATYTPSGIRKFIDYKKFFKYNKSEDGTGVFQPLFRDDNNAYDWLYLSIRKLEEDLNLYHQEELIQHHNPQDEKYQRTVSFNRNFTNKYMFSLITDETLIDAIKGKQKQYSEGEGKLYDLTLKEDMTAYNKQFLRVSNEDESRYYTGADTILAGNLEKLGIKDKDLLFNSMGEKKLTDFRNEKWNKQQNVNIDNKKEIKLGKDDVKIESTAVQQLKIYHLTNGNLMSTGELNGACSLFGCPFYYMQNQLLGDESTEEYISRNLRVKSLLFLHSFPYNYDKSILNVFSSSKKNGMTESIPKAYALLLGGLLWRNRYYQEKGIDPIIFKSGDIGYKAAPVDFIDNILNTLFIKRKDKLFFSTITEENPTVNYDVPLRDLFGGYNVETLDRNIINQFINLFEQFAVDVFDAYIQPALELLMPQSVNYEESYILRDDAEETEELEQKIDRREYDKLDEDTKDKYVLSSLPEDNYCYNVNTFSSTLHIFNKFFDNYEKSISYDVTDYTVEEGQTKEVVRTETVNATSENFLNYMKTYGFSNWEGNYSSIVPSAAKSGLTMLFNEKETTMQNLLKNLYFTSFVITDMSPRVIQRSENDTSDGVIRLSTEAYNAYIDGFIGGINDVITKKEDTSEKTSEEQKEKQETTTPEKDNAAKSTEPTPQAKEAVANPNSSEDTHETISLNIGIYYYLKNVWDRWISPYYGSDTESTYDVSEFFDKNFVFIDSFYKNIYNKLAINLDAFYNAYYEADDDVSLFSVIGTIVQKHQCLFLPVPDYIGFGNNSKEQDIETMKNLFRPMPYNEMPEISYDNKFICIYTHSPSEKIDDDPHFRTDSYDIMSHSAYNNEKETDNGFSKDAIKLFKDNDTRIPFEERKKATLNGYYVPSFGVAFNRQNNHIFKNIRVDMANPMATEQSILSNWRVMLKGQGSGRTVCFIGQDTFNIFSNYSYNCEVEMMGNAQICPLMYFQLLNIPMWRGTYMIFKVMHTMTPGNMITRFSGMKMSKFAKPWNDEFFTILNLPENGNSGNGENADCADGTLPYSTDGNYGTPGQFTGKDAATKLQLCGINGKPTGAQVLDMGLIVPMTVNGQTIQVNRNVVADLTQIFKEINNLGFYHLQISSSFRKENSVKRGMSRHCWGVAVDINAGHLGNPWFGFPIASSQSEPPQGMAASQFGYMKMCPYSGVYDRSRCIWHWGHPVVKIFLAHGWGWGGSYGDVMHFSIDGH